MFYNKILKSDFPIFKISKFKRHKCSKRSKPSEVNTLKLPLKNLFPITLVIHITGKRSPVGMIPRSNVLYTSSDCLL